MKNFFQRLLTENKELNAIMKLHMPKKNLTPEQMQSYISAENCWFCKKKFTENYHKCKHHNRLNDEYIGLVCNTCNLQLKITDRRRSREKGGPHVKKALLSNCVSDDDDVERDNDEVEFTLPVLYHNMKCYNAHLIYKHFKRKYCMRTLANGKIAYDGINVINQDCWEIYYVWVSGIRFIDSYLFPSSSHENMVSILVKSGIVKFEHSIRHLGDVERDNDETEFTLPVLYHNMKCYDAHLIYKYFKRKYCMRTLANGNIVYDGINVIIPRLLRNLLRLSFGDKVHRFISVSVVISRKHGFYTG
jgi:hypothetical protein